MTHVLTVIVETEHLNDVRAWFRRNGFGDGPTRQVYDDDTRELLGWIGHGEFTMPHRKLAELEAMDGVTVSRESAFGMIATMDSVARRWPGRRRTLRRAARSV